MNISVEKLPDCHARLTAEVPVDKVNQTRKEVVAAYASQVKVPGFRPGKTPASVVEKKFSTEIDKEVRDRLARLSYSEAKEKEDLSIMGIAKVESELFTPDGGYSLVVDVVAEPDIEIADYKGIPVEVPRIEVTDEMVDDLLENARKMKAEPADVDRVAQDGDMVVVDFTASLDGEDLAEVIDDDRFKALASGEERWFEVPEHEDDASPMFPGLQVKLDGIAAGETREIEVAFPEDFPAESLAGKTALYKVTATQVKERVLPELDDEFARGLGAESVGKLRELMGERLRQQQESNRINAINEQILTHLNGEMTFDLPQHVVANETRAQINEMIQRGMQQGMTPENFQENQEEFTSNAEAQARNNVKTTFIINEIAERENLRAEEGELAAQIQAYAREQGRPFRKVVREIQEEGGLESIAQRIRVEKVLAFLRENAEIVETDPPGAEES